jgi:heat shock protein HslJ
VDRKDEPLRLYLSCAVPTGALAANPADLAGTEWVFPGEVGKTARFIQFRSDGKIGGSTGCNRFTGSYSQDGYALTIGTLATRACPPDVMKREQQFLVMLEKSFAVPRRTTLSSRSRILMEMFLPN